MRVMLVLVAVLVGCGDDGAGSMMSQRDLCAIYLQTEWQVERGCAEQPADWEQRFPCAFTCDEFDAEAAAACAEDLTALACDEWASSTVEPASLCPDVCH